MEFDLEYVLRADPASMMKLELSVNDFKSSFLSILKDSNELTEFLEIVDLTEVKF